MIRRTPSVAAPPKCDVLLFVATKTEMTELGRAAADLGLKWQQQQSPLGRFWDLGDLGSQHVVAVKTEVGALGSSGSARNATYYIDATATTSLICLGMGFGIDRRSQRIGDVLVSETLFPYDVRSVVPRLNGWKRVFGRLGGPAWIYDYGDERAYPAKRDLLRIVRRYQADPSTTLSFRVSVGCMLTGSARIASRAFRDELLRRCLQVAPGVIGGEMEGAGFLSLAKRTNPGWLVVKGICDFADEKQTADAAAGSAQACANAARFVLEALRTWNPGVPRGMVGEP